MSNSLLFTLLALTAASSLYAVRSLRTIGSKVTEVLVQGRALEKKLSAVEKKLHADAGSVLAKMNLLNLQIPGMAEKDFNFILSLTSHPACTCTCLASAEEADSSADGNYSQHCAQ